MLLAVIAAIGVAVAGPLLRPRRDRSTDTASDSDSDERTLLEARKEAKYREIRDAEADFRTGKLSEADYRALDRSLRREAIEILSEIDELHDSDA